MGVGAALVWQTYGDEATQRSALGLHHWARCYPPRRQSRPPTVRRLRKAGLPQSLPVARMPASAAAAILLETIQLPEPMTGNFAGARCSLEQLAATQEQMAQNTAALQAVDRTSDSGWQSVPGHTPPVAQSSPCAPPASTQPPLPSTDGYIGYVGEGWGRTVSSPTPFSVPGVCSATSRFVAIASGCVVFCPGFASARKSLPTDIIQFRRR